MGPREETTVEQGKTEWEKEQVRSLMNGDGEWNLPVLNELFETYTIKDIQTITPLDIGSTDEIVWAGESSGRYSVKSGCTMLRRNLGPIDSRNNRRSGLKVKHWKKMWSCNFSNK